MAIITLKCTQCGANIQIDNEKDIGVCEHCGMSFIIEKTINNYTINNINIIQKNDAVNHTPNNDLQKNINKTEETVVKYIGNVAVSETVLLKVEQYIKNEGTIPAVKLVRELSGMNLAEAKAFVENFNIIDKSKPHLTELLQKQNTKQATKNNNLGIAIIIFCLIFIIILCTTMDSKNETTEDVNVVTTEETTKNNYQTEIAWALEQHYACAVEVDDYNGDILESGTYLFYPDAVMLGNGKMPVIWDIYISNNYYNNISDLKDEEYVDYVGGIDKHEFIIDLEKGQYVYVKYNDVLNDNPTGYLKIEKSN